MATRDRKPRNARALLVPVDLVEIDSGERVTCPACGGGGEPTLDAMRLGATDCVRCLGLGRLAVVWVSR